MTNKTEELLNQWEVEAKSLLHNDCFYAGSLTRQLKLIRLVRAQREALEKSLGAHAEDCDSIINEPSDGCDCHISIIEKALSVEGLE